MAINRSSHNRYGFDFSVVGLSGLGGALIGLWVFIAKIVLTGESLLTSLPVVILNPLLWVGCIVGIIGFLLFQKALHSGHVSLVLPTMGGVSLLVPVLLSVILLNDPVGLVKWAGILCIVIAVVGLSRK